MWKKTCFMAKVFKNLTKNISPQVAKLNKCQQVLSRIKKAISRHIIVNLLKAQKKETILKQRGEKHIKYKGITKNDSWLLIRNTTGQKMVGWLIHTNIGEDLEQIEPSYIDEVGVKWYTNYGSFFCLVQLLFIYNLDIILLVVYLEKWKYLSTKHLVWQCLVPKLEAMINRGMYK